MTCMASKAKHINDITQLRQVNPKDQGPYSQNSLKYLLKWILKNKLRQMLSKFLSLAKSVFTK
jgi:hypothetical protein